jgi:hypothetical protein
MAPSREQQRAAPITLCVVQRVARRKNNPWTPYAAPVENRDQHARQGPPGAARHVEDDGVQTYGIGLGFRRYVSEIMAARAG